jgi:DnaJ-class molecular chaperone
MENLPSYKALNRARKILGLPEIATMNEIKSAYHKLVKIYHPDRCPEKDKVLCNKKMVEINNAYKLITTYIQNYKYIFTEKAYKEQDMEYAVRRFFDPYNSEKGK